ncbi:MAG: ABC transporter substrate-binding protein [Campylobacterales bacterium]|nr:ABC transporter substrate-binding protein [Campylobacterales bacterium]
MKKIFFSFVVVLFVGSRVFANETAILQTQFENKIQEVVSIVKDKTLSKESRNDKIVKAITPMFDFELMAKLSLGKVWQSLTSNDQRKFVELYVKRMKTSYSSKLDSYSDEKVVIKSVDQIKVNRIQIATNLVSGQKQMDILYKFHKPKLPILGKNDWVIYDVEILGVSILKTDMAQFKGFLQNNSIYDLMNSLEKQI